MSSPIVIVEDNNVVRECLEEIVNSIPGCDCLAAFACAEEAIRYAPRLKPDLVLMDIQLPNLSGIECAAKLKETHHEVLQSLSKGLSNKEIADLLSVTFETVRWHLKQIYEKQYVHGRTHAALKFMNMQNSKR